MMSDMLMKFDPATGEEKPYPSHAEQWREWHGKSTAFLFNPWWGNRRHAGAVGDDPFGYGIVAEHNAVKTLTDIKSGEATLLNQLELAEEDLECVHLWLDDMNVPRNSINDEYSIVGRMKFLLAKQQ